MSSSAGIQQDINGRIITTTNPPEFFFNGLAFAKVGADDALCIDTTAPIAGYTGGLPFTATGALAVTAITPLALRAFSNGFSNGFQ